MEQTHFMISDAAKKVEVETHVLRYWEEELKLTIKRNELGHRYYTKEDVERFICIKKLKEQGFQLKAIRYILINGNLNRIDAEGKLIATALGKEENKEKEVRAEVETKEIAKEITEIKEEKKQELQIKTENGEVLDSQEKEEKNYRLQFLLKHLISEAVKENNQELADDIKSSILKELDYQFRQQDEKEEEREKERRDREEEHYRKLDEVMRMRLLGRRKLNKKKRLPFE